MSITTSTWGDDTDPEILLTGIFHTHFFVTSLLCLVQQQSVAQCSQRKKTKMTIMIYDHDNLSIYVFIHTFLNLN
jgi:hypothetical protein